MFITYTHVDQIRSRSKKWQVQSYQNARRHALKAAVRSTDVSVRAREPTILPWTRALRAATETSTRQSANELPERAFESLSKDPIVGFLVEDEPQIQTAVGSLRREPFSAYPMENSQRVQLTVDYFTQVYAPMHAQNYRDANGGNWLLSNLFKMALQADLLFESTVTFVWSQLPPMRLGSSPEEHERALMSVRGSVMRKLHHRLSVPKLCSDDVTIHTVLNLMAADFHRGQDDHVELHREGLRRIVTLRGGLSQSDIQPQTRYSITATEMMCDYAIRRRKRSPKTNITPDNRLEYPTHPFPPALSKLLSVLPEGFSDMALTTLLSYQVIKFLYRMAITLEKGPAEFADDTSIAVEMMRLSMRPDVSALEQAVVTLSFVFARFLFDTTKGHYRVSSSTGIRTSPNRTYVSMKKPLNKLAGSIFGHLETAGTDFVVWAVFILSSTTVDYGLSSSLQQETLQRLMDTVPAANQLEEFKSMVSRFFWHESLVPRVDELWKNIEPKPES